MVVARDDDAAARDDEAEALEAETIEADRDETDDSLDASDADRREIEADEMDSAREMLEILDASDRLDALTREMDDLRAEAWRWRATTWARWAVVSRLARTPRFSKEGCSTASADATAAREKKVNRVWPKSILGVVREG